jgi:NAD(P)-dependent dehydrogenase (short-subunit alcohol dehydrogenase family)
MKTVLITGCSSGFGLEVAKYFLDRDWNVIATMRAPNSEILPPSERLRVLALDVTDPDSIRNAVDAAGPIDALVNNAGVGAVGALEGMSMQSVRAVFETNTFGTMAMIQAFLPGFRLQQAGVIVNVTSSTTFKPLPLLSVYTASKAAIEAFSNCLALELTQFNIRVRMVIPGRSPDTRFRENAQRGLQAASEPYAAFTHSVFAAMAQSSLDVTRPLDVAQAVWRAVNDASSPMAQPAGADAVALAHRPTSTTSAMA